MQGLDLLEQKAESFQKSSFELKDQTLKVVDQTRERLQAVRSQAVHTVQSKVQSVLTLPSNVVPLVDQILNAGEHMLDYLLPDIAAVGNAANKNQQNNGNTNNTSQIASGGQQTQQQNNSEIIRLVLIRMRSFTDKVKHRFVDYTRDHWVPNLVTSVVVVKLVLEKMVNTQLSPILSKVVSNGHQLTGINLNKISSLSSSLSSTPTSTSSSPSTTINKQTSTTISKQTSTSSVIKSSNNGNSNNQQSINKTNSNGDVKRESQQTKPEEQQQLPQ